MSSKGRKFKVMVTNRKVHPEAIEILEQECELVFCDKFPSDRQEILEKCRGVDGIFWTTPHLLNAEVLDAAGPQLKCAATISAGLDTIDVNEMKRRGIQLGYVPFVSNAAVAEHAVGLMIAAGKRFHQGRLKIKSTEWKDWHIRWMLGQEIRNSTVGLVGFGGIGQNIAELVHGFVPKQIIYTCRHKNPRDKDLHAKYVKFDELLRESDFIVIACPLTNETNNMFSDVEFQLMKPNCVLVNISRGPIVDHNALYNALKLEQIFAAGLDVTVPEPLPADHPLLNLPNCVITPHLAASTYPTRETVAKITAHNILLSLCGGKMLSPAFTLPQQEPISNGDGQLLKIHFFRAKIRNNDSDGID